MTATSIETMTGRFVDLVNPDPKTISIHDIAWALSRMPRYVAHTVSAVPYTIGQHSIFVTQLVQHLLNGEPHGLRKSFYHFLETRYHDHLELRELAILKLGSPLSDQTYLELLLHDASEAYIVDIPTPLKQADGFRQVYAALEHRMMDAIRQRFGMGTPDPVDEVLVKWADAAALTIEAYHLVASRGRSWSRLLPIDMPSLRLFEEPREPIKVYEDFLDCFEERADFPVDLSGSL